MNIVVVGGGTSGCISALILKQRFPQYDIHIIESSKIGTIGVGEGSTEHWTDFCDYVDIDMGDVLRECGATFKMGILFDKWDDEPFMHSLLPDTCRNDHGYYYTYAHQIVNNYPKRDMQSEYVWNNECPDDGFEVRQLHFDTDKLNEFLHKKCFERGISVHVDDIKYVHIGEGIEYVEGSKRYYAHLFIDCTGFRRLLISKLGVGWKSYSEYLPLNSAITFPTAEQKEYNMWTKATAYDAGWGWTIPTRDRTGNGYVFCDKFITTDEAKDEMRKHHGQYIRFGKEFKFDPGRVEKFWERNCIAVGLAGSFVEPLEASSIGSTIQQVFALTQMLPSWSQDRYNKIVIDMFDNIVDYIVAHYLTRREDTPFWKYIKENLKIPKSLQDLLSIWEHRLPHSSDMYIPWEMFHAANYVPILHGLNWFNVNKIKHEYDSFPNHQRIEKEMKDLKDFYRRVPKKGHKRTLQMLTKRR